MDRTTRHEIIKKTEDLNNTTNQLDICRTHHSTRAEHTFFSEHMEHSLGWTICQAIKQSSINIKGLELNKVCSLSSGTELEITSRRKFGTQCVEIK